MKKIILTLAALLLALSAFAVPARPGVFQYTQPDGSVVRLERHGDEFFSWTTLAGTTQAVELGSDGYWRKTTVDPSLRQAGRERRRQMGAIRKATAGGLSVRTVNPMTHGERHIPVLLVAYSDRGFMVTNPREKFSAMLNENGYSDNGGTGSVQDFYVDNSHGAFRPIFDVYGPVTLPHDMKYYGEPVRNSAGRITIEDSRPEEALRDACRLLDDLIEFSQYDYDHDGEVDMTLFYYAGYNTAEGGSHDAIWPHQGYANLSETFDGMKVNRYFCTSELKGTTGVNMCGIGTTCHEFGHSLGLPDFYDTDYEENGECSALTYFSTMCSGSYLNDGRTPPYFNAEERIYLGWMEDEDVPDLPSGTFSFGSIKDDISYRTATDNDGEYFIYECRDGSGWDSFLPQGLVVYHADKSPTRMIDGMSAYNHWYYWEYYNDINAYGDHPCFYIVPAADQTNLFYKGNLNDWVFPGTARVTSFMPEDWDGGQSLSISGISYSDGQVTLSTTYFSAEKTLMGTVTDLSGNPVAGATVVLSHHPQTSTGSRLLKLRKTQASIEVTTDESGAFSMNIEEFGAVKGRLTVSKAGFRTNGVNVDLKRRITTVNMELKRVDQGDLILYSYYDPEGTQYVFGDRDEPKSQMASILIPAESIPASGGTLKNVSVNINWPAEHYYIIVDAGTERLHTIPVDLTPYTFQTVNLLDQNLTIPGGQDIYIGIGYENAYDVYSGYEGLFFSVTLGSDNCWLDKLDLTSSHWNPNGNNVSLVLDATIIESRDGGEEDLTSFAQWGFPVIADPGRGVYTAGREFQFKLETPEGFDAEVSWLFDGSPADGSSVTLSSGAHTVTAILRYSDGSEERLDLDLQVENI